MTILYCMGQPNLDTTYIVLHTNNEKESTWLWFDHYTFQIKKNGLFLSNTAWKQCSVSSISVLFVNSAVSIFLKKIAKSKLYLSAKFGF